ncbi:MAG TPA: sulfatase [Armatimonadota bacterium]|nr:sulfatase [Armatimonadota bacterium]
MKAIMVMFDSLNRRMLSPYGCDWVHTPNFQRLAERCVTFENCYVGSMPCMPARRELHTGRYNFLHRSWGPIEPFDDSMPHILDEHGIHTHLVSDHYHYWEDGGATYHTRYSTWDAVRGQEGDPWKAVLTDFPTPETLHRRGKWERQDFVNRSVVSSIDDMPQAQTFARGIEFLRTNHHADNWFLQLETFDPHEPYFVPQQYQDLYPHAYTGAHFDWPHYKPVEETPEQLQHLRYMNAALVSMCDDHLGKVLDVMDELHLWDDTLLIVNTDHGFLLGEHDWLGKCAMPFYNEIAHTPLFIWDPRCRQRHARRDALVQTIDLAPTLLDYFNVDIPADMQGHPLRDTVANDAPVRDAALYGIHGGHVNCTDARYVYMRAPATDDNQPLFEYTHMPTHMRQPFQVSELQDIQLTEPMSFTKGCRIMKIPTRQQWVDAHGFGTMLFDLFHDPAQEHQITDPEVEEHMIEHMVRLMKENDAPVEQFARLGLPISEETFIQ